MIRAIQNISIVLGSSLLLWFVVDTIASEQRHEQLISQILASEPDTELWSDSRIESYQPADAIGVIRIADTNMVAPIVAGTSELDLDAGVGWLKASSGLDGDGNIVLAAHRDGFFRTLKDIPEGTVIEIITPEIHDRYVVTATQIVQPEEIWVLQPTDFATLTLVTCYPFYFVGSAPQRFVVNAHRLVN